MEAGVPVCGIRMKRDSKTGRHSEVNVCLSRRAVCAVVLFDVKAHGLDETQKEWF